MLLFVQLLEKLNITAVYLKIFSAFLTYFKTYFNWQQLILEEATKKDQTLAPCNPDNWSES